MLKAYTDVSVIGNNAVGVAILMSEDTLIDYAIEKLYGVEDSFDGELRALLMAARMVKDNFSEHQDVTVYVDCLAVVKTANKCLRQRTARYAFRCQSEWQKLLYYTKNHTFTVKYTESHLLERTPNAVCDLSSRIICKLD